MPPSLVALGGRLAELGWVTDLWIAGSLATGDYVPGVSDIDLVAVVDGPVDQEREAALVAVHEELAAGVAAGADLGCVYVEECLANDPEAVHLTWTHGVLVRRILSGITRAELVRHGSEVLGRAPTRVLASMTDDDVREAACPPARRSRDVTAAAYGVDCVAGHPPDCQVVLRHRTRIAA